MEINEILFALSNATAVGNITEAADLACDFLSEYCKTERMSNLTVLGFLEGESDYTLMLDAHIDQIAMVVTNVDDEGFLTVTNAGGIDARALPTRRVTVHSKQKINAVFCSLPPHLSSKDETKELSELKIDTLLGSKAKNIVSVGDFVTFATSPESLLGDRVVGKSFDDRAGVACLIEVAKRLKGKRLPMNVVFVLSDAEELGLRGATTATFKIEPNEAIAVDVSFGDGIGISGLESGVLGKGAMVGISPALDKEISSRLIKIAEQKEILYQTEVMGAKSGTNADTISVSKQGVRACTLSIPLRNMHTDVEILDLKDLNSVCDLICEYILSGGVMND